MYNKVSYNRHICLFSLTSLHRCPAPEAGQELGFIFMNPFLFIGLY